MGDRIKRLRQSRKLTQQQLGSRCGVTKQAVSRWEGGIVTNIELDTFLCLAKELDTDPHYLVWGAARTPPNSSARGNKN